MRNKLTLFTAKHRNIINHLRGATGVAHALRNCSFFSFQFLKDSKKVNYTLRKGKEKYKKATQKQHMPQSNGPYLTCGLPNTNKAAPGKSSFNFSIPLSII